MTEQKAFMGKFEVFYFSSLNWMVKSLIVTGITLIFYLPLWSLIKLKLPFSLIAFIIISSLVSYLLKNQLRKITLGEILYNKYKLLEEKAGIKNG
jgi:membrane protein implicated in regulation of membrane protease activity